MPCRALPYSALPERTRLSIRESVFEIIAFNKASGCFRQAGEPNVEVTKDCSGCIALHCSSLRNLWTGAKGKILKSRTLQEVENSPRKKRQTFVPKRSPPCCLFLSHRYSAVPIHPRSAHPPSHASRWRVALRASAGSPSLLPKRLLNLGL